MFPLPYKFARHTSSNRSKSSSGQLEGKIIMITGGGGGVGKACAIAAAKEGCTGLVLVGRKKKSLIETVEEIRDTNCKTLAISADITDPQQVERVFLETKKQFKRLDILFNNAGCNAPAVPLEQLKLQDWKRVVDVNLTGAFLCTQQAFRIMKGQVPIGGRIINNGSVSADRPRIHSSAYTSTKHAITGLTKSVSLDGRDFDIACGQIDIGNAKTDMTQQMEGKEPLMDVNDIARAFVYMCSLPLEANTQWMTVMATKMKLIGRG